MFKKKKFLVSGIIVFLAIGVLGYMGLKGGGTYNYTVAEMLQKGNSVIGQTVRVGGTVQPGSLQQTPGDLTLKFTVVDEAGNSIPVVYKGVVPDTFKVGNEVVVEGTLDPTDTFQAKVLMPKCPSKYTPAK